MSSSKERRILLLDEGTPESLDALCSVASKLSGQKFNWGYFCGRGVIRFIGDRKEAAKAIQSVLPLVKGPHQWLNDEGWIVSVPFAEPKPWLP